jgi:NTP pyrophosphatase (non-canonical NTP hydrolase)
MPTYRGEHEDVILPFIDLMRHKTATSKYRGQTKWLENTPEDNFNQLMEEVKELAEAMESKKGIEIMMEAADVANWAMFIAHQAMVAMATPRPDPSPNIFKGIPIRNGERTVVIHQDTKGCSQSYTYVGQMGNASGGVSHAWRSNITDKVIFEEDAPWREKGGGGLVKRAIPRIEDKDVK